jgi:hypothetical protein
MARPQAFVLMICALLASLAPGVGAAPIPGVAAVSRAGGHGVELLQASITLDPITVEELAGGALLGQPAGRLDATFAGGTLNARGAVPIPPLRPTVRRTVRGVWRVAGSAARDWQLPRVNARIESIAGGNLLADADGGTGMAVRVIEAPLRRVAGREDELIYEGDLVLEIPVAALTGAGRFRGRLMIDMEQM